MSSKPISKTNNNSKISDILVLIHRKIKIDQKQNQRVRNVTKVVK